MSHWRSIEEKEGLPTFSPEMDYEYTPSEDELKSLGVNRRKFIGLMGASMALAGVAATGCRKPVQNIMPYNQRPEDMVLGKPMFYATAMNVGRSVQGLLVKSQEGRPIKIEGNPDHPSSNGATDVWGQSSVLDLYDPDRSRKPARGGRESSWEAFFAALDKQLANARKANGKGLAVVVEEVPSPSFQNMLGELRKKLPQVALYKHDPAGDANAAAGQALVGASNHRAVYYTENAKRILSVDSDFLGVDGDSIRQSKGFAKGRDTLAAELEGKLKEANMNRLYVVETAFSTTGVNADHRMRVRAGELGDFLAGFAGYLLTNKVGTVPAGAGELVKALKSRYSALTTKYEKRSFKWKTWYKALSDDFAAHLGKSLVMVGESQPAAVHAVGHFVNLLLGNVGEGKTVQYFESNEAATGTIEELASSIKAGEVSTLVVLGGNPAYSAPGSLDFATLVQGVDFSVHLSLHVDETSQVSTWHVPMNHYLESWGDLRSTEGVVSVQQPLIAPLYGTLSNLELLAYVVGDQPTKGYDIVQGYWKSQPVGKKGFKANWKRWLHEGLITEASAKATTPSLKWNDAADAWRGEPNLGAATPAKFSCDVRFQIDPSVCDGRFANNPWLQELPDPMTKLTWDNAALMSPKMARDYKFKDGQWIELSLQGRSIKIPVYVAPGVAENTILLPFGYGRDFGGRIAKGAGFNVFGLRPSSNTFFASGATFKKVIAVDYQLVSTQDHGRMEEFSKSTVSAGYGSLVEPTIMGVKGTDRVTILREANLESYQKEPGQFEKYEVMPKKELRSLWTQPNEKGGQQWGMVIDLNKCNGCNVCTIACQSENNISVVGKERVAVGREMHWIRIDRYFTGDQDEPEASVQPMGCVHCENAPCENVCPVAATVHSPEGMNDMAYNRCIGTRYCANNCPYKVRRFNFFNYSKENTQQVPLLQMQRNPDVTVRFRGVMEKCSYCVQRVNAAKIDAKRDGNGYVPDGAVTPACAQACPSEAIVFGDVNDPKTRVAKLKKIQRNYAVLRELNNKPRTTYLARLRNRNPKI
ncbi:MAG: 4Fe-4S dicluster domain-containing protein [Deltaproteobacteria bacterium]|nr:MAG: 4Fe-4S dicluster domain-containing protein [Deltaproteobacteria bacterium]